MMKITATTFSVLSCVIILLFCSVGICAQTVIYDNTNTSGYSYTPGTGEEVIDYGTSNGGNITRIIFGYVTDRLNPGTITIRFYRYTDFSTCPGSFIKSFQLTGLEGSNDGYLYYFLKDYDLPANQQFNPGSGDFGYSFEFTNSDTGVLLASGGSGNENYFWYYDDFYDDWWWMPGDPSGDPWAGFYMKLYSGPGEPVVDPNVCDIEGYKFDDSNADGNKDGGEPGLQGWEIYVDTNNNGLRDTGEPNTVTDATGYYKITDVEADPATCTVAEVMQAGWRQTYPGGDGTHVITTDPNGVYRNINFGNTIATTSYCGGSGTEEDPYLICTPEQMNEIGANYEDWDKHFKLMNDIDLGIYIGDSFNIIGSVATKFTGVFNGNGKKIYNFTYTSDIDFIGLFREIDSEGLGVKNLGLINPNVTAIGSQRYWTGALTGRLGSLNNSTISNCYVMGGNISGGYNVGGLVGKSYKGQITECYAKCQVSGVKDGIGGLVGEASSYSSVSNSYSISNISGDFYVGGLIGQNSATITNCYASGTVTGSYYVSGLTGTNMGGNITASYWDTAISRISSGSGGEQKTTEEMQTMSTYTDAGWDFDSVWAMCDGTNYPRLAWQELSPMDFVCPDGVEVNDLIVLCEEWLSIKLAADIAPNGCDGFVDYLDWVVFANAWLSTDASGNWNPVCDIYPPGGGDNSVDMNDLVVFIESWLDYSACLADIAPEPADEFVDLLDFVGFAQYWLEGI
jgi:GLUG motif-containing protein